MIEKATHTPDWQQLKALDEFTVYDEVAKKWVFSESLWNAIEAVRSMVNEGKDRTTLYYPGARYDVPNALALFNPTTLIFSDPEYKDPEVVNDTLKTLEKLVGDNYRVQQPMAASEPVKVSFRWNDSERTLFLYPQDAAIEIPAMLHVTPADYLLLKNTFGGENSLETPKAVEMMTSGIISGAPIVSVGWVPNSEYARTFNLEPKHSFKVENNVHLSTIDVYVLRD